jgi:DNA invertase Pin-like site-specific DNA recombinase
MSIDTIRTLVGNADSDDPSAALRAIAELRRELDAVETVTVRRARNAGLSWQIIALALGVSRQAVHKKYGRR